MKRCALQRCHSAKNVVFGRIYTALLRAAWSTPRRAFHLFKVKLLYTVGTCSRSPPSDYSVKWLYSALSPFLNLARTTSTTMGNTEMIMMA